MKTIYTRLPSVRRSLAVRQFFFLLTVTIILATVGISGLRNAEEIAYLLLSFVVLMVSAFSAFLALCAGLDAFTD